MSEYITQSFDTTDNWKYVSISLLLTVLLWLVVAMVCFVSTMLVLAYESHIAASIVPLWMVWVLLGIVYFGTWMTAGRFTGTIWDATRTLYPNLQFSDEFEYTTARYQALFWYLFPVVAIICTFVIRSDYFLYWLFF